jgi:hypothetical protein
LAKLKSAGMEIDEEMARIIDEEIAGINYSPFFIILTPTSRRKILTTIIHMVIHVF